MHPVLKRDAVIFFPKDDGVEGSPTGKLGVKRHYSGLFGEGADRKDAEGGGMFTFGVGGDPLDTFLGGGEGGEGEAVVGGGSVAGDDGGSEVTDLVVDYETDDEAVSERPRSRLGEGG